MKWQLNLFVLSMGNFFVMAGMTMIIPFLPLYLKTMGMQNEHQVAVWGGMIFAVNFLTSFLFQPLWGSLADRHGRKIMVLRSGFGMAIVMTMMGFATSAWHLLILRLINGTISGFVPASVALISANTPKKKTGLAMGILQSGGVAGTILGPLFGGVLADTIGYRPIFYITGGLLFVASMLVMFLVKEQFNAEKAQQEPKVPLRTTFRQLVGHRHLAAIFAVSFIVQFAVLASLPIMPLFVEQLHGQAANLALFAGLVSSINGFSNMISSPVLGRLSDRIGAQRILAVCMVGSALSFIPQAIVENVWQLLASRFLFGLFMGGLLPSIYTLIRKYTPDGMESRAYSFNSSSISLGNFLGPITGGALSGFIGVRGIFIMSAVLMCVNAVLVFFSLNVRSGKTQTGKS